MLALIFMPCCDNCDSQEHNTPTAFQTAQEHHQDDNDVCSPFCNCSCCAIHITIVHPTEFTIFPKTGTTAFTPFKQSFPTTLAVDCWQPPRLA